MFGLKTTAMLYERAQQMGLEPTLLTEYGLMAIKFDGRERYIFMGSSAFNTQLSANLCRNKHVTRVILARHNLPNIPYSLPQTYEEAKVFFDQYQPLIIKPTVGGKRSEGVILVSSETELQQTDFSKSILEQYIKGREERHLVLNGEVLAVHLKLYEGAISSPAVDVERVALEKSDWDIERNDMAVKVADIMGLSFAAIDFIVTDDKAYILEVNSAPGLSLFQQPHKGPSIDMTRIFLEASIDSFRSETGASRRTNI